MRQEDFEESLVGVQGLGQPDGCRAVLPDKPDGAPQKQTAFIGVLQGGMAQGEIDACLWDRRSAEKPENGHFQVLYGFAVVITSDERGLSCLEHPEVEGIDRLGGGAVEQAGGGSPAAAN